MVVVTPGGPLGRRRADHRVAAASLGAVRLRSEGIAWQDVEGEIVCLDLRISRYFSVNATGRALWLLLVAGADQDRLVSELEQQFDVGRDRAESDVAAFVEVLAQRDLLVDG
jgi:hypothetical protein